MYQSRKTFLHALSPAIKFIFLLFFPFVVFAVSPEYLVYIAPAFIAGIVLFCLYIRCFDSVVVPLFKTCFFYAVFLYFFDILYTKPLSNEEFLQIFSLYSETTLLLIRLTLTLFFVSLIFNTTSSSDFRFMFFELDDFFRKFTKKKKVSIGLLFSLLLTFIPMVFRLFAEITQTWKIRHAKISIKKWLIILPCLFSLSFEKAKKTAQSLYNRKLV